MERFTKVLTGKFKGTLRGSLIGNLVLSLNENFDKKFLSELQLKDQQEKIRPLFFRFNVHKIFLVKQELPEANHRARWSARGKLNISPLGTGHE